MSLQPLKVSLPDGREINVDVEEVVGKSEFQTFLDNFKQAEKDFLQGSQQDRQALTRHKLFFFFTPKVETPTVTQATRSAYALYQNGNNMALYVVKQNAKTGAISVSHCDPINDRTITPEIRPLIMALNPQEIHDVGRLKGIRFDKPQDLIRQESGETMDAFKRRVIEDAVRKTELLEKQEQRAETTLRHS